MDMSQSKPLLQRSFEGKSKIAIGRAADNDIQLDGLLISSYHARAVKSDGRVFIEDLNSTNGVYANGARIVSKHEVQSADIIQIGPFNLNIDLARGVVVSDTRAKTRIDILRVTKEVPDRSGGGRIKLLDEIDLAIEPNEFVGLLGPSGAGKSTLMDALNGMRPATSGFVLFNKLDLYRHLDSIKQSIGYVPQEDIIHRELTVYSTLYYVAQLRLSRDVSAQEIEQIISEVLDLTGLSERRDVTVGQLSGGQRKRVSIAVELITKPSVIFLDEPTSGLDPATEEKIMILFRQIAESGRSVILTTHAMENVKLFDKLVVLMRGKLVFYGAPHEALTHLRAASFKELYDKLEAPVGDRVASLPPLPQGASPDQEQSFNRHKERIAEEVAESWKKSFQQTEIYQRNIYQPLSTLKSEPQAPATNRRRRAVTDSLRQWKTLTERYIKVLVSDKLNLLILFGQAPIIALLTYLVVGRNSPRDFIYFIPALVAVWFGASISAREIIRERAVYQRERMVNLGLLPYVGSKVFALGMIVCLQCLLLFGSLKAFQLAGLIKMPAELYGLPQFFVMCLTSVVGIAIGLLISAFVRTSEMATSLVPLILIPQILFSGLVGVPQNVSKIVGLAMPATWSFDSMKRFSTLDTLSEEGSNPAGENQGRGLYKHLEHVNDQNIAAARKDFESYRVKAEKDSAAFEGEMQEYVKKLQTGQNVSPPVAPKLGEAPQIPPARKVPEDLSNYIDFLHPWGGLWINVSVLVFMFCAFCLGAILALRARDV